MINHWMARSAPDGAIAAKASVADADWRLSIGRLS